MGQKPDPQAGCPGETAGQTPRFQKAKPTLPGLCPSQPVRQPYSAQSSTAMAETHHQKSPSFLGLGSFPGRREKQLLLHHEETEPAWTLRSASPHPARPQELPPLHTWAFSPLARVRVIQPIKPHRPGVHAVVNGAILKVNITQGSMSGGPLRAAQHGQPQARHPLTPRQAPRQGDGPWTKSSLVTPQGHQKPPQHGYPLPNVQLCPLPACKALPSAVKAPTTVPLSRMPPA